MVNSWISRELRDAFGRHLGRLVGDEPRRSRQEAEIGMQPTPGERIEGAIGHPQVVCANRKAIACQTLTPTAP